MSRDKLVYMANQIATFFGSQPREDQVARTAGHFSDYWDPRMRAELIRIAESGASGLSPLAAAAAERLRAELATDPPRDGDTIGAASGAPQRRGWEDTGS